MKQLLVGAVIIGFVGFGADAEAVRMADGAPAVLTDAADAAPSKITTSKTKKKAKKKAADQEAASGEATDGVGAVWGKHPSIRYGSEL